MLQVIVGNIRSRLQGEINDAVSYILTKRLTYRLKDAFYIAGSINQKRQELLKDLGPEVMSAATTWDGTISLYWPENKQFYTGMMSDVLEVLEDAKIQYEIDDRRERPAQNMPNLKFEPPAFIEQREYQDWTVKRCLDATRGIIHASTGSGKTLIFTKLIAEIKTSPFIILVLSIDLMDQAVDTLSKCLRIPIGRVGGGYFDIQDITVMTVPTAVRALNRNNAKFDITNFKFDDEDAWDENDTASKNGEAIERLIRSAKGVLFDEVHHCSCESAKEVLLAAKEAYWKFGASATIQREDGAEKMVKALFGRAVVDIPASWLIQNKYLVRPYIFNVKIKDGEAGHYHAYKKIYSECIVNNKKFNQLVSELVQFFEQRDVSSLTLVQHYDHGYNIQEFLPDLPFIKGDMAKKGRRVGIQDLRDGKIKSALATSLADEGLDIKRLGAVIVAGGGKSITRIYQRIGRVLRTFPGKDKAFAIVFHHDGKHLKKHGTRVKNILAKESEFRIINSTPETIFDDLSKYFDEEVGTIFGKE